MRPSQFLMAAFLPLSLLVVGCGEGQLEAEVPAADLQQTEQDLIITGVPQRLAVLESVGAIQTSATHLYINGSRTLQRVPKAGGAVETILSIGEGAGWLANDFALDDKYIWIAVLNSDSEVFANVIRVPIAGGEPVKLLEIDEWYSGIAVDATWVYFAIENQILRYPKEGPWSEPEVIASGLENAASVAVDGSNVYWIDMGPPNPAIGCFGGAGKVLAWNKFTRTTRVLASGETCPMKLVLDGTSLYWIGHLGKDLRKISTWSYFGFAQTVANDVHPYGFATDASYLYLASADSQASYLTAVGKLFGLRYTFPNTREDLSRAIATVAADAQHVFYMRNEREIGAGLYKLRK